jgi:hypothetical protein
MGKGRSWGAANDMYAESPVAKANTKIAEMTGVMHRVCGLLGLACDVDELSAWCAKEEKRRREECDNKKGDVT